MTCCLVIRIMCTSVPLCLPADS